MKKLLLALTMIFTIFTSGAIAEAQKVHKVVIQVSTNDPKTQKIALNNAVNLQKLYGMDGVKVEIVAYGPGLSLLMAKNPQSSRVSSLAQSDIKFSACMNTMEKFKKSFLPSLIGLEIANVTVTAVTEIIFIIMFPRIISFMSITVFIRKKRGKIKG